MSDNGSQNTDAIVTFPVLELDPEELVAEHQGRWVSLSRARLGPEEEDSSPYRSSRTGS